MCIPFFFFNDTATTEIYTLSLHDALPISANQIAAILRTLEGAADVKVEEAQGLRSEEHTSELQSQSNLVCRLLLEKKKNTTASPAIPIFADVESPLCFTFVLTTSLSRTVL